MRADTDDVDHLERNLAGRSCVADMLTRSAALFPDRPAIVFEGRSYSHSELDAEVNRVARGLLSLPAGRQEPVAMLVGNRVEFVQVFFACARTGRVATPINLALGAAEIEFVLRDVEAKVLVVESRFLDVVRDVVPRLRTVTDVVVIGDESPERLGAVRSIGYTDLLSDDASDVECVVEDDDIVSCLYTSGTTADPKGVLTRHVSAVISALNTALQFDHRRGARSSVQPIALPLFHTTGIGVLMLPTLLVGGTVILFEGFDATSILDSIAQHRATHLLLLPAMWEALLAEQKHHERDTTSLVQCMYGMAPMPTDRIRRLQDVFPAAVVVLGSGQTEFTPPTVLQWPEHQIAKADSWGAAMPTVDVRIMDPDGRLLPSGSEGEIVYRGPQCMDGYWNRPGDNQKVFAHGWLHSGDIGWIDDEGVLWFMDRVKDIVKSGGENVSSVEVERILLGHPSIQDSAVIGLPDERWGEAVTAVVVTDRDGEGHVDEAEILAYCRDRLAGFKVPKRVVFVPEVPRTSTGKIRKHELRSTLND